jgi:transposase
MLSQHIITQPIFDALFEGYSFTKNNPISIAMQSMVDLLESTIAIPLDIKLMYLLLSLRRIDKMKPISQEKRELIISAKERKETILAIAQWLEISISSVKSVWRLYRQTGNVQAKAYKGRPSRLTEEMISNIHYKIAKEPDSTLEELITDLGLPIKKSQLSRWLLKNGYTFKKTLYPANVQRADVVAKRGLWRVQQLILDSDKLVFVDASSVNCGMIRLYARSHKSQRVNDYVPDVRFERTSFISSIRLNGEQVPLMFKGTLNGSLFSSYVSEMLAPSLKAGDIVIIDNFSAHKVPGALDPIYEAGAEVMFLPPYSPDLNPIELGWSKMKSVLRKLKPRSGEELMTTMKTALESLTVSDIAAWFKHNGYMV